MRRLVGHVNQPAPREPDSAPVSRAALLDPHAGLRNPGRRAAQDAALGPAPELRRLGAVPGRRLLRAAARARDARRRDAADPRIRVAQPRGERRHRRRLQRRPGDGRAASSSPCSTTTTCCTPTPSPTSPRRSTATPRPTTSTPTRTRSTQPAATSNRFFKPDWSPERLRTQMYTCHLSVLRRSLVEEVGGFDPEFEGSQDWDLVLKVTERARAVAHVPRVLYHWRILASSTAGGSVAKPWAFEAGRRAVQAHCDRIGLPGRGRASTRRPRRPPPRAAAERAAAGQHRHPHRRPGAARSASSRSCSSSTACAASSSARPTRTTRSSASSTSPIDAGDPRGSCARSPASGCGVVPFDGPFDFSAKINLGAVRSEGKHLLLLNDDIEVTTPNWLERMVMYFERAEIGAVGGRLLWGDTRLQHVGVGFDDGLPHHHYRGFAGDFRGYMNAVRIARDCLAVTGACLMTRARLFAAARRPEHDPAGQLQRRRLLPQGPHQRPPHRLRPRPRPLPLRVLEPRGGRSRNGRSCR